MRLVYAAVLTWLPKPIHLKRLDCCSVLLALTSAAAVVLCMLGGVEGLGVNPVGDMALLPLSGRMSEAALCAAAKSSDRSA